MKIRIKSKKYETMKFAGRPDMMRYFQKVIRHSDMEIYYNGGFSPHQTMPSAVPLEVGIISNGEYAGIEASDTEDSRITTNRLNQVMSEGFGIISLGELLNTAGNAMSIVAAADHTVVSRSGHEPKDMSVEEWFGGLLAFYEQPEVMVMKKTKRGQAELDIKPLTHDLRPTRGEDGDTALLMKISTGSSSNLKPELALDTHYGHLGQERTASIFLVQREEVHADLGGTDQKEKGNHTFIPLEELGQEIL